MVYSDLRSHRCTLKLISYIIAQIGTRKKALPRNARTESLLLFEAMYKNSCRIWLCDLISVSLNAAGPITSYRLQVTSLS